MMSTGIILWVFSFLICGCTSTTLQEEMEMLRLNYTLPILGRINDEMNLTQIKLGVYKAEPKAQFCPCTFNNDTQTIQELRSFGSHVDKCTEKIRKVAAKLPSKEERRGEAVRTVTQQIQFLKNRIKLIKNFLEKEEIRIERSTDNVNRFANSPIFRLVQHLKLDEDIRGTDPRGPRKEIYTHLTQQNKPRKSFAKEISRIDVCSSFQKTFCTIRDIVVLDRETYIARIKQSKLLMYYHINGTLLGKLYTATPIQGLARVGIGKNVLVGSPKLQKVLVVRLIPDMSIVQEVDMGDRCPYGLTEVEERLIAIACANSIRLYDLSFNLLNEFPIANLTKGKGMSWLTYNPVSRLLLFVNSVTKRFLGINLDGDVVFSKEASWFPLAMPTSVVVNENGDQYVVDMSKKRIVKYGVDGSFLGHLQKIVANSVGLVGNDTLIIGNQISRILQYKLL